MPAKLSSKALSSVREHWCSDHDDGHIDVLVALSLLMHNEAKLGVDQPPPCINTALPLALLSAIFEQLGCHDLVRCQLVCRLWNVHAKEQDRC